MSVAAYDPYTGLAKKKKGTGVASGAGFLGISPSMMFSPDVAAAGGGAALGLGNNPTQISLAGFIPDYGALIGSDPYFTQQRADLSASGAADRAGLRSLRQRAVASFGDLPDFSTVDQGALGEGFFEDITPETRALAASANASGLSTTARLKQANEDAVRELTAALSARGLLRSGESGFQLDRAAQAFKQGNFDAVQQLLGVLGGGASQYTQAEAARRAEQARLAAEAEERQRQANPPQGSSQAMFDHVDAQGRGVYRGPDGRLYFADGSPYSEPPPDPYAWAQPHAPSSVTGQSTFNYGTGRSF